jgi:hypothetical protein
LVGQKRTKSEAETGTNEFGIIEHHFLYRGKRAGVLLEKPPVAQLLKNFPFYGT